MSSLVEKYGPPTTPLNKEMGAAYDLGKIDQLNIGFDKNTVFISLKKHGNENIILLIYTSLDFEKKMDDYQKKKISSEI